MRRTESALSNGGTGFGQRLWPVLLLLSVVVLIPTACVLWFMNEAVGNERLAIRQRLADVYRGNLESVRADLQAHWRNKLAELDTLSRSVAPAQAFYGAVSEGNFDSVVVTNASGLSYPNLAIHSTNHDDLEEKEDWLAAATLEHELNEYAAAVEAYAQIAGSADQPALVVRALQGQVRCLLLADRQAEALEVLCNRLLDEPFWRANDSAVQQLVANGALMALRLLKDPAHPDYARIRRQLMEFVSDYANPQLGSAQRLFLMDELRKTAGPPAEFPTLAAERLAAEYLSHGPRAQAGVFSRTELPEVWAAASADGAFVALVSEQRIRSLADSLLTAAGGNFSGASVTLSPADRLETAAKAPFLSMPAGDPLAGWELSVVLEGPNPFETAAQRRISGYIWIGGLVILTTVLVAGLVGRHVGRQVRLTRLKNDLIATVSHELKTPLSSIRALVDTLLTRDGQDPRRSREYLQLIARENERLSRLIDNFLAFSRMERNRHTFSFVRREPAEIVERVRESLRERLDSSNCSFEVKLEEDLPEINADTEAMATVLINLLDNAWKYTGDDKRICLRAYAEGDRLCFAVSDNGVGLSRRVMRRVFDRFYQVDQSLSRRAGGCGLGLSIVQFIVRAHHGRIEVDSKPGQGSTFTISLPAERTVRSEVRA